MKCTEPPVRWPRSPDSPKHSAIDALAGEGSVAGNQKRHRAGAVLGRRAELVLLGAGLAEHHRIDDFKMRRVGREREMNPVIVELAIGGGAEVIFDVAGSVDIVGR